MVACGLAGQLRCQDVQLVGLIGKAELFEHDGRGLKTVGGEDVGAGFDVGAVDIENPFRVRAADVLVAVFQPRAAEIGSRGVIGLEHGAHGAIQDQDARGHGLIELFPAERIHCFRSGATDMGDDEEPASFILHLHDFQSVEGARGRHYPYIGWIMGRHEFLSGGDADT